MIARRPYDDPGGGWLLEGTRLLKGTRLLNGGNHDDPMVGRPGLMAKVEKVSVALTPELLVVLREALASGEYTSSSEVLREALRQWNRRRTLQRREVGDLRRLWEDGLASGTGRHGDLGAIKAEARRRLGAAHDTDTTGA